MHTVLKKYAIYIAYLQIVSIIGLAVCSIWYGAWYPDAQARAIEELKANDSKIDKPGFWLVSRKEINLTSPVAYTSLLLILSIFSGIGVVVSAFRLEELEKRESEFKQEQEDHVLTQQYYYEALKEHLVNFFCQQIDNFDDTCRASVYRHDQNAKLFRMVFRHSKITRYEAKGRVSLPEREGVIGATYLNGDSVYIYDLPIKTGKKNYFKDTNKKLGSYTVEISEATLNRLNMPSRCYYGYAIRDFPSNDKFAILIMESTNPAQFDDSKITTLLSANSANIAKYVKHIAHIDSKLNPYGGA